MRLFSWLTKGPCLDDMGAAQLNEAERNPLWQLAGSAPRGTEGEHASCQKGHVGIL